MVNCGALEPCLKSRPQLNCACMAQMDGQLPRLTCRFYHGLSASIHWYRSVLVGLPDQANL
jgi:hypothetical protein